MDYNQSLCVRGPVRHDISYWHPSHPVAPCPDGCVVVSKPPAEPEACRLLAPQRGLFANGHKQKHDQLRCAADRVGVAKRNPPTVFMPVNGGLHPPYRFFFRDQHQSFSPKYLCLLPDLSNSWSPPAKLGVYLLLIRTRRAGFRAIQHSGPAHGGRFPPRWTGSGA